MTIEITTDVGRFVQGNLYKPNDKDANGKPLVVKSGPNIGQPRKEYYAAVAVPKRGETHWNQTPWGAKIWNEAALSWPQGQYQNRDFAWKITDGDSTEPNKKGKKPCDSVGFPGHWILRFSGGFAPQIYNADGTQKIVEENAVKPGYFIQINGTIESNKNTTNPGVYLNHRLIAFAAYGEEIHQGPDAAEVGFGGGQLPPGASAAPVSGGFTPAPALQGGYTPPPVATPGYAAPTALPLPAVPMAPPPNPAILQAPIAPQMTPKAAGATYDQMRGAGWTDDLMRQHGYLV